MKAVLSRVWHLVAISIVVILGLAALAGLGGCGGEMGVTTTAGASATTAGPTTTAGAATTVTQAGSNGGEQGAPSFSGSSAQPNVSMLAGESGQKIIGDAVLDIEVASGGFQTAFNNAALLSDRYGGYIVASESNASGENGKIDRGTIAIRVPAASFSAAIADAGKLGTLKNQQIKTQDVTEEYVDLQARIINSQAKLDTFRKLFDKATTINDIVNVQQVLTAAEDELEQLKGRQRFLQEHTSYSTLTMNIREAGTQPVVTTTTTTAAPWGVGKAFGDAAHNFVKAVNAIVRALGILVPVLVVLAIIAYIVYRSWRWNSKRQGRPTRRYQPYPEGWKGPEAAAETPLVQVPASAPSATTAAAPSKPAGEADTQSKPAAAPTRPKSET
jgi:Domain of unknown function (DUF4349)